MDTAYKTRAWWMMLALSYTSPVAESEQAADERNGRWTPPYCPEQYHCWSVEGAKAGANAVAPAGSEVLTRIYVDRRGNLLEA